MTTLDQLLDKAKTVYDADEDCFTFLGRMCDLSRDGLITRLLGRVGFDEVLVLRSGTPLPTKQMRIGDVLLMVPRGVEIYKTHVALYAGDGKLLSKWGLEKGLVLDTYEVHASHYCPRYTTILRRVVSVESDQVGTSATPSVTVV